MSNPSSRRRRLRQCFEYRNCLVLMLLLKSIDANILENNKAASNHRHDPWWLSLLSANDDINVNVIKTVNDQDPVHATSEKNAGQKIQKNWIQHLLGLRGGSASSETTQRHAPQVKLKQNKSHKISSLIDVEEKDDQGIDQYIESLIATVDSDDGSEENEKDGVAVSAKAKGKRSKQKKSAKEPNIEKKELEEESTPDEGIEDDKEEDDEEEDDDKAEEDDEDNGQVLESPPSVVDEAKTQVDAGPSINTAAPTIEETSEASSPSNSEAATASSAAAAILTDEPRQQQQQQVRPVRPNFLYRFLLGQGRLGHVIILLCVMVVELLRAYLPPVERFLTWAEERYRRKEQIRFRQELERRRQQQQKLNSKRRKKQDKKSKEPSRRALQKEADQRALSQLRQLGNVAMAKYRWVSDDFMKRHGLGPFASTTTSTSQTLVDDDDQEDEAEESLTTIQQEQGVVVQKVKQRKKKSRKADDDDEEDSDTDWIVQALTTSIAEPPVPPTRRGASSGVTLEFHLGNGTEPPPTSPRRRGRAKSSAWIKSILSSSSATSSSSTKSSTATARSKGAPPSREKSVLDQLRAVSGVDNMSRSLLGAYPGDAVPTKEAASADGLLSLAQKYGYGEWSDDDEDDEAFEDQTSGKSSRRKVVSSQQQPKRRKKPKPEVSLGLEEDNDDNSLGLWGVSDKKRSQSTFKAPRRRSPVEATSTTTSRSTRRQSLGSDDDSMTAAEAREWRQEKSKRVLSPPLASSAILNRRSRDTSDSDNDVASLPTERSTPLIRPALDRLKEKMKELQKNPSDDDDK